MEVYKNINDEFETRKIRQENGIVSSIEALYTEFCGIVSQYVGKSLPNNIINDILNKELRELTRKITLRITSGIQTAWQLSEAKTWAYVDKRLKGYEMPKAVKSVWYDPNESAMREFVKRKAGGMSLSERVWEGTKQAKKIINKQLSDGIYEGKSAAYTARTLREGLNNPDKFFRRVKEVRNGKTVLVESRSAEEFHPGQGVYKSPVKNSERLTRTEINRAYRTADQKAWANNPLVIGYEILLSNSNKAKIRCELCRTLAGKYPSSFVWAGWHPQCLCYKVPILMSREQMDQYQKLIASGKDTKSAVEAIRAESGLIKEPPAALGNWVKNNSERVKGWANTPYWWSDNLKLITGYVNQ